MGFKDSIEKHWCNFPFEITRNDIKSYWECDDCGAQYKVSFNGDWTGWWASDTMGEVVRGVNKYGTPTVYPMDERFYVCAPSVVFKLLREGTLWGDYHDTSITLNEEMPDFWKQQEGQTRPLWRGKTLPADAHAESLEGYGLSRVASPGDKDLGLPPELKKAKKRWWLQSE